MLLAMAHARDQRNRMLVTALNVLDRHRNQVDFGIQPRLSQEEVIEVAQYAEALRNVPQQKGFPHLIVWPDTPRVLKKEIVS